MIEVFLFNNPKILFDKNHIGELANKDLDYTSKLNAVTKISTTLALFGLVTDYMKILMATAVTLVTIVIT